MKCQTMEGQREIFGEQAGKSDRVGMFCAIFSTAGAFLNQGTVDLTT